MIFSSFNWELIIEAGSPNTTSIFSVDVDFRALYQINRDQQVVLGYASIQGTQTDAASSNLFAPDFRARLIGNFNETSNVLVTETVVQPGVTITPFAGISFNNQHPFIASSQYKILMPPTFRLEFQHGKVAQISIGDKLEAWITLGYQIFLKGKQF